MTLNLSDMTSKQLVDLHNDLCFDVRTDHHFLKGWKQKKTGLITIIEELQEAKAEQEAEAEAEAASKVVEAKNMSPKARTIRAAALELLTHVDFYEKKSSTLKNPQYTTLDDKDGRSVGLPYSTIIKIIQDEFKGCSTSVACLRWYAVKIRVEERGYEGLVLPQRRPRSVPTK